MSLIAHWKLDDNAASTTIVATVGTNQTLLGGDNTSTLHVADGPGNLITNCLDLDGTTDSISVSGLSVPANTAFSVSAWAKFDGSSGPVIGRSADADSRIAKTTDTNIRFQNNNNLTLDFTVPSLGTGTWRHILLTKTAANSVRLFVDGVESSSGPQTLGNGFAPIRIGRGGLSDFLDGRVAWVKFFDSDESGNVATLYAEGVAAGGTNRRRRLLMACR